MAANATDLLIEDHRDALAGPHAGRRFMAAAIDWTAALVRATAGLFSTYDDRERVASPIVILLPESYDLSEANQLYADFFASGLGERSPLFALPPQIREARVVGTEELGGGNAHVHGDYWRFVIGLGVTSQLALLFRDDVRIIGSLLLSRMQGQEPFTERDRALLLRIHPLLESGFVLAESHVSLEDRVAGVYGRALTARELQVALLVADGARNQQVAEALYLTEATVKTHLHHVFQKLGVRSRSQLASRVREATAEGRDDDLAPPPRSGVEPRSR